MNRRPIAGWLGRVGRGLDDCPAAVDGGQCTIWRQFASAVTGAALLVGVGAQIAAADPAGQITVVPTFGEPVAVAPGSDGNLWYADQSCLSGSVCGITRLTLSGRETEFPRNPPDGTGPIVAAVTPGPDGQVWFTDWGCTVGNGTCAIGRVTVSGKVTEFGRGLRGGFPPDQIAPGSDGAVWFIDGSNPGSGCCSPPGSIGRITPSGRIAEYTRPGLDPVSITPGPDGDEWFVDNGHTPAIGRITPSGKITEYPLAAGEGACGIANGPDGNLWFTQPATLTASGTEQTPPLIGKVTLAGQITEYSSGLNQAAQPCDIATGADGNLWFADDGFVTAAIGRVTPSGQITEFSSGLEGGIGPDGSPLPPQPHSIVPGPDGDMWFTAGSCGEHSEADCVLQRIGTGAPAPKRLRLSIAHAGPAAGGRLTLSGSYTAARPGLVRLTLARRTGRRAHAVLTVTRFGWPGINGFGITAPGGQFRAGAYQLVAGASNGRQTATADISLIR